MYIRCRKTITNFINIQFNFMKGRKDLYLSVGFYFIIEKTGRLCNDPFTHWIAIQIRVMNVL